MTSRIIIIGDVHGCFDELTDLLDKVRHSSEDRLVFLGDLVDRGPKAIQVIQLLHKLKAECVVGNHDDRFIRYRRHMKKQMEDPSYVIPMKPPSDPAFKDMTEADWDYLMSFPNYIRVTRNWVALHAGLEPTKSIEEQDPGTLLHCRYLNKFSGKAERSVFSLSPATSCLWPELWDGKENVVYGHMVTPTRTPHITLCPGWGALCVGIDTGCCFGYALTAMILDPEGYNFSFVSVPARQAYDPDLRGYLAATTVS